MKLLHKLAAVSLVGASVLLVPALSPSAARAQQPTSAPQQQTNPAQSGSTAEQPYQGQDHDNIQTSTSQGKEPTKTQYTETQLLTSTVHQAWLLSGKNEANFFEIVEQLADISSHNRGVKLPDSAAAGRRMGDDIKRMARADTDRLLYAVVDKAVVNATTAHSQHASSKTPAASKSPAAATH